MKDTYQLYQEARDAAWRTLLRLHEKKLPVDMHLLLEQLHIPVLPFPNAKEEPRLAALLLRAHPFACISLRVQGVWQIFLKEHALDENQQRFALAHELGHMVLHHPTYALDRRVHAFRGRENAGDLLQDPEEIWDYAADIFAIRLLSPACVLHDLYLDRPLPIAQLCGLPPRAAGMRAERMELLNQRDAFLSHPLERQVRNAFLPFVNEQRHLNGQNKKEQSPRQREESARVLLREVEPREERPKPKREELLRRLFPWAAILWGIIWLVLYYLYRH
ncbi:MAG: ImmA/IrrE family metallo-endopeptidase [Clostridiales bacterium]|nr:ImmA/IrrE family metallo-endopeptidase [Clostridiales bacterium]